MVAANPQRCGLTLLMSVALLIEYEAVMTASASKTPMPTGSHEHWAQLTGETLTAYPDLD